MWDLLRSECVQTVGPSDAFSRPSAFIYDAPRARQRPASCRPAVLSPAPLRARNGRVRVPDRRLSAIRIRVQTALAQRRAAPPRGFPPRGDRGFGYDPIFVPVGGVLTFGEMDPFAKDAISHRARAFAALEAALF